MMKFSLAGVLKWPLVLVAAIVLVAGAAAEADAGFSRRFILKDHSDGNQNPPPYGLRLDGLFNGNTNDEWTFSFEMGNSLMFLDQYEFDDGSRLLHIHGTAYGGLQGTGSNDDEWVNPDHVTIDFQYREEITYSGTENGAVVKQHVDNKGTVVVDGTTIDLVDFADSSGNSFLFLPDGHRLPSSKQNDWVGRGWLNHSGNSNHIYSSDWLFTIDEVEGAQPIPEPSSILLLTLGGLGLLGYRRRLASIVVGASSC